MDAVFAILVLGAVIFFGALISAGNERQRKALEGIREQTAQWAMQDLHLKREKLAREVKVDDPLAWLNQVVAKVCGENLGLTVTEVFDDPQALMCNDKNGHKVVFSPVSPDKIRLMPQHNKNQLLRMGKVHPLFKLPRDIRPKEISVLNGGVLFDLELMLAWPILSGGKIQSTERIWIYFCP